jgi:predicted CXXCH cytochrome family protein
MNTKGFASKSGKLVAFAIAMLMISSFGIEFLAIGLVMGIGYAAYTNSPLATSAPKQRRKLGLDPNMVILAVGALAVISAAMIFTALPGPAPVVGADLGARAPATYKGVDYCKTCHGPGGMGGDYYTGWKETGHGSDLTNRSYHGSNINIFTQSGGSCQKCHVVGYNNLTLDGWDKSQPWNSTHNSALQGIQCENCHGPGSEHTGTSSGIIANPTPEQSCNGDGQSFCHGPGGHDGPMAGTTAWNASLHSPANEKALEEPEHYMNAACSKCHSPSQYDPDINSTNPDYNISKEEYRGVSCSDCHEMHGDQYEGQLKHPVEEACTVCHTTDKAAAIPGKSPGHRSQKEMFLGIQGANVTGTKGMPGVECVDCHMWYTPAPVRGTYLSQYSGYPLNSDHSMNPTAEACAACHSTIGNSMPAYAMPPNANGVNATNWTNWDSFLTKYKKEVEVWNTTIEDWQAETIPLLASATENTTLAKAAIDSAKANKTKDSATLAQATALWGDAYWNYKLVESDKSNGVHNHDFAMALLRDAMTKSRQVLDMMAANSAPVASAGPSKVAYTNQPVTLDGSASSDMDGTIMSYFWDCGDGTNCTDKVTEHTYTDNGIYYVKLTVTDNKNATGTAATTVFVNNVAPVANAGDDKMVALNELVAFNASDSTDSDGDVENYTWDLGDGTTGYGAEVEHAYSRPGAFAVILRVTDDDGAVGMDAAVVTVTAPGGVTNLAPLAAAGNDVATKVDTGVTFNASGSSDADGTIVNYTWSFGDGTLGYGAVVDHSYSSPGAYAVLLTVTDDKGETGVDVAIVTVERPVLPPVDLGPVENNVTALKNDTASLKTDTASLKTDTASLKTDMSKTLSSVGKSQNDTTAMKKDVSDTKKAAESVSSMLGAGLVTVLVIALVATLALHLVAGKETVALRKELKAMKARGSKQDAPEEGDEKDN